MFFYKIFSLNSNIILAVLLICISVSLAAASFDCSEASIEAEYIICDNPKLSLADEKMASAYKQLRNILDGTERSLLLKDQRRWLKERNFELRKCTKPDCDIRFYQVRIEQLGLVKQASFNCERASTLVEKKICNSLLLKHADGRIAKLFKPVQEDLAQDQREWLKERDRKLSESNCDTNCAWQFYKERIEFLVRYAF